MKQTLFTLLSMSVSGGILAGVVYLIRALLQKRVSKAVLPLLWALVGVRLVMPFTLAVAFSPFPAFGTEAIQSIVEPNAQVETDLQDASEKPGNATENTPVVSEPLDAPESGTSLVQDHEASPVSELPGENSSVPEPAKIEDSDLTPAGQSVQTPDTDPVVVDPVVIDPVVSDPIESAVPAVTEAPAAATPAASEKVPTQDWLPYVLLAVWIAGVLGMLVYFFLNYLRLRKKTRDAVPMGEGIYCSNDLCSPFILGIVRPKVFLPKGLSADETRQVLAHEKAHLERYDHLTKVLAFFVLAIHWFNPLVWLAYLSLSRDIEFACDERAIRGLDTSARKEYGETLLRLSTKHRSIQPSPLSFGEVGVKARLMMLFKKQKTSLWLTVLAAVLTVSLGACLFTTKVAETAKQTDPVPSATEAPAETEAPTESASEKPSEAATTDPSETAATEAPTEKPTEAPTEPPTEEANGLTEAYTFDQIYGSVHAKALDPDERTKLVNFLEAEEENRLPRRLPKLFLVQAYRDPSEIDLSILFYDGTEKGITLEERQAAAESLKKPDLVQFDVEKRKVDSMIKLFRQYTGQEPTEKQLGEACSKWIYLEKYDAYYSFFTDTVGVRAELKRACRLDADSAAEFHLPAANGDLIALEWTVPEAFRSTMGTATGMILLAPNGNSWTILANYYLPEAPKDLPESVTFDRIYQYVNVQKLTKDEENEILPTLAKVAGSQAVLARACRMDAASAERFKLPVAEGDVIAVEWVIPADRQLLEAGTAAGVILLTPSGEGWDLLATYIVPGYQGPSESDCQPVDPEKWNENLKQTIELGHSHGFRYLDDLEDELDADLVKALKEYERFFSGLYWQHLDLNEFSVLSFSDTVLYDAKRTMEYYKAEAQRAKDVFTYAETNLSHLNIQSQGDMVTIDVKVWTECEYMSPRSLTAGGIFGRGTDHRLVLQKKTDGTFLLVSDSFDERPGQAPSYPAAHSSDR